MAKEKPEVSGRKILKNLKKNDKPRPTGWGPASAIVVTLLIYFGSQLIAGYLVVQYLFLKGDTKDTVVDTINNSVNLQFILILIAESAALLLLWWFLKHRRISWRRIGLSKPTGKNLLYSIPAYGIYFTVILIAFLVIQQFVPGVNTDQSQQVGFDNASGSGPLALVFLGLVILPALTEEILVRGFLFGGLRNKLPFINSALITSALFGLAHLQLGSGNSPLWIAAVDTFILSLVLVWLREKTGNIWAGVIVHMAKNSIAFISLFVLKSF